jgi:hypothetical protein
MLIQLSLNIMQLTGCITIAKIETALSRFSVTESEF